jgi:hypothetical protein
MPTFKTFYAAESMTYEEWLAAINLVTEEESFSIPGFLSDIKQFLQRVATRTKLGLSTILAAFQSHSVYVVLKAFSFDFNLMYKSIHELFLLENEGLLTLMNLFVKRKTFERLRNGVEKIDTLMDEHPILKHVTGVAVAGIILFIWLHSSHIGNPFHDLDLTLIVAAIRGHYTLADMFTSNEGIEMLVMFAVNAVTGLTVAWLGEEIYNLILAICYTGLKEVADSQKFPALARAFAVDMKA